MTAFSDPFTFETRLCDDDGMVSREVAFHGGSSPNLTLTYLDVHNNLRAHTHGVADRIAEPFRCTGSAHLAGQHIRCTSPAHVSRQTSGPGAYVSGRAEMVIPQVPAGPAPGAKADARPADVIRADLSWVESSFAIDVGGAARSRIIADIPALLDALAAAESQNRRLSDHDKWATNERSYFYTQMFVERDRAERAERALAAFGEPVIEYGVQWDDGEEDGGIPTRDSAERLIAKYAGRLTGRPVVRCRWPARYGPWEPVTDSTKDGS